MMDELEYEEGVWVVFYWDWNPHVRAIYKTEIEALRRAQEYKDEVKFLKFGEDFT